MVHIYDSSAFDVFKVLIPLPLTFINFLILFLVSDVTVFPLSLRHVLMYGVRAYRLEYSTVYLGMMVHAV